MRWGGTACASLTAATAVASFPTAGALASAPLRALGVLGVDLGRLPGARAGAFFSSAIAHRLQQDTFIRSYVGWAKYCGSLKLAPCMSRMRMETRRSPGPCTTSTTRWG